MKQFSMAHGVLTAKGETAGSGGNGKTTDPAIIAAGNEPQAPALLTEAEVAARVAVAVAAAEAAARKPLTLADRFEQITFQVATPGETRTNPDGSSTVRAGVGALVHVGGSYVTPFTVYAKKAGAAKNAKTTIYVSLVGNMQKQAIMPVDERGKAELAAFKAEIAERFIVWKRQQLEAAKAGGAPAGPVKPGQTEIPDDLTAGLFD